MRKARKIFALLLTLAMVLAYMPLAVFADIPEGSDEHHAVKLEFVGGPLYYDSEEEDSGQAFATLTDSLYKEGNAFILSYNDTETETWTPQEYEVTNDGETYNLLDFFLDGDKPEIVEEDGYPHAINSLPIDGTINTETGLVTFIVDAGYSKDVDGEEEWVDNILTVDVQASPNAIPESIEYSGDTVYYTDEEGPYFHGFWLTGNTITLTWKDGTVDKFVSKICDYKDEDGLAKTVEYFPEGVEPSKELDEGGYPVNRIQGLGFEPAEGSTDTFIVSYYYGNGREITTEVKGKTPVSLTYDGPAIYYEKDGNEIWGECYQEGAKINIKYSDGSTRTAVCTKWGTNKDDDGNTYDEYDYFFEGTKPEYYKNSDGYNEAFNREGFEFDWENASTASVPVKYMTATANFPIEKKVYPKPVSVKFVPAKTVTGLIGQNWFYGEDLFGKGNKFVVTYSDGSEDTYTYGKIQGDAGYFYGFRYKTEDGIDSIWPEFDSVKTFKKGNNTLKGYIELSDRGYTKDYKIPFTVTVKASKYYSYALTKFYTYTGKTITPKVTAVYVAKDNGKMVKLKASKYTYKPKKAKKIGRYKFTVKLKSKADKKKYGDITCYYTIAPKKPTGVSVTAGSKKFTVKWKKQSNVDGFLIMASKSKSFKTIEVWEEVGKSKTSITIKGVKKGTTYYVRVIAFKNDAYSLASKTVKVTVK